LKGELGRLAISLDPDCSTKEQKAEHALGPRLTVQASTVKTTQIAHLARKKEVLDLNRRCGAPITRGIKVREQRIYRLRRGESSA